MMNQPDGNKSKETINGPSQALEFYGALERHLHDLKNLLWPLSVQADCAPIESASAELVMLMNRFRADVQEALEVATRMSELVQRQSGSCGTQTAERVLARRCTSPPAAARMRILCVIDDSNVRGTLAHLLVYLGHDADSSCNGATALQSFASRPYDVVVTDIHLADMNGRDLTRNLRANGPIPVIWLTGAADVSPEIVARRPDSPTCILVKPLSLAALRKALDGISRSTSTSAT